MYSTYSSRIVLFAILYEFSRNIHTVQLFCAAEIFCSQIKIFNTHHQYSEAVVRMRQKRVNLMDSSVLRMRYTQDEHSCPEEIWSEWSEV
jgi:hypothetical protein